MPRALRLVTFVPSPASWNTRHIRPLQSKLDGPVASCRYRARRWLRANATTTAEAGTLAVAPAAGAGVDPAVVRVVPAETTGARVAPSVTGAAASARSDLAGREGGFGAGHQGDDGKACHGQRPEAHGDPAQCAPLHQGIALHAMAMGWAARRHGTFRRRKPHGCMAGMRTASAMADDETTTRGRPFGGVLRLSCSRSVGPRSGGGYTGSAGCVPGGQGCRCHRAPQGTAAP